MEIKNIKEYKMKQLLLPIFFLLTVVSMAQTIDAPIGYTPFLNLKQYAYEANPGADSLNHNNTLIDNFAKAIKDSTDDIKADVRNIIGYDGGVIDGAIAWADLSTSAKSNIVQTAGTQNNIGGSKGFTDDMTTENIFPSADITYNLGSISRQWYRGYFNSVRTRTLVVINPSDTAEIAEIGYDGAKVSFDKPVEMNNIQIKETFKMDSAASFNSVRLLMGVVTPSDVADSILALDSLVTNIRINAPGDMLNVERLDIDGVSAGSIVILWSMHASNDITLKDNATDGNLNLAGDFTIAAGDCITLMYYYDQPAMNWRWMEISRSNN